MCEELSSKCRLSVLGLTNHAAIMSWTTVEPRQTGASWSERYTLPRILILRWPTCLTGTCSTCSPSRRSEEHTSELQSRSDLVCRLLLEKKKNTILSYIYLSARRIARVHTH